MEVTGTDGGWVPKAPRRPAARGARRGLKATGFCAKRPARETNARRSQRPLDQIADHRRNFMKVLISVLLSLVMLGAATTHATNHTGAALTEGEVRKIDKDAKKLTIRHGPIANLEMPAMTMVFQVKDPAVLETIKTGDRVRFTAGKEGGIFTVTHVEVAK